MCGMRGRVETLPCLYAVLVGVDEPPGTRKMQVLVGRATWEGLSPSKQSGAGKTDGVCKTEKGE